MLQGLSSNLFYWDHRRMCFLAKPGIHVLHLSTSSLHGILGQFGYAATCLKLVDLIIERVNACPRSPPPTLRAFASSVSSWVLVSSLLNASEIMLGLLVGYRYLEQR